MTSTSTVRSSGDSTYLESGPAASPWKSVSNPIVKRWAASRCSIEAQLLAEAVHSDSMLTELQAIKMRADKLIEFQRLKDAELKDAELKDAEGSCRGGSYRGGSRRGAGGSCRGGST